MTGRVRTLWLVAVLVVAAGYALVIVPGEREVVSTEAHAKVLYDEENIDESKLSRAAELSALRSRIQSDLHRLGGDGSTSATAAAVLDLLEQEGKRFHTDVRSISPGVQPVDKRSRSSAGPLKGSDWDIVIRGGFRDILSLIADTPRHDVLLEIRDVDFSATGETGSPTTVDATVHTTIYQPLEMKGTNDARTYGKRA